MTEPTAIYDIIVIGGGPAGSSAAITAARGKRRTLVVDKLLTEGALGGLGQVGNFPGYFEPINGAVLIERMRQQAAQFGTEFKQSEVKQVDFSGSLKKITTADGETFQARSVIVATGCMSIPSTLPGERELFGKGVHYSALQAGPNYQNETVGVYGKSPHAAQEALYLTRFVQKIVFVVPGNRLSGDERLQIIIRENPKIELMLSASVKQVNGASQMESFTVLNMGQDQVIPAKAIFLYTQAKQPMTDFLKGRIDLSGDGCVLVDDHLATNVPGVFAGGDLLCGDIQQPVIAAAQGAIAAMSADYFLQQRELAKN